MAIKNYRVCDKCSVTMMSEDHASIFTGRHMDLAGSMDDDYAGVDLCGACWPKYVAEYSARNKEFGESFVRFLNQELNQ